VLNLVFSGGIAGFLLSDFLSSIKAGIDGDGTRDGERYGPNRSTVPQ